MKRTTSYLSLAFAALALAILLPPFATTDTMAKTADPAGAGTVKLSTTDDEASYWYFVVTYNDSDKRVTNTFYATGAALKVYYKVRVALDGFQGDIQGTSFATREEADQDRATKWPNAQPVA